MTNGKSGNGFAVCGLLRSYREILPGIPFLCSFQSVM